MKKSYYLVALALALALPSRADEGTDQLSTVSPAPGKVSLIINPAGLTSMTFNFRDAVSQINRNAEGWITLERDGELMSRVAAYNPVQLSFDNIFASCYQLSFFLSQNSEVAKAGAYRVTIPEGFFLLGEEKRPNEPIVLDYTVDGPVFTLSPEPGRYEELYRVILTVPNATKLEIDKEVTERPTLSNMYASETAQPLPLRPTVKNNQITFTLFNAITTPGSWMLDIPEGYLKATMEDGTVVTSDEYWGGLYVIPDWSYGIPALSPAGDLSYLPGTFTLTLENHEARMVDSMGGNYVYKVNEDGTTGEKVLRYQAFKNADDAHIIELRCMNGSKTDNYVAPGRYRLVTAPKLFNTTTDQTFCSSMQFEITVVTPETAPFILSPSETDRPESVASITASFPGAQEVSVNNDNICWLSNSTVNFPFYPRLGEDRSVVFTPIRTVTLPGEYTFTSASGCVTADGANYVVSGTITVAGSPTELPQLMKDEEDRSVYDMEGRLLFDHATDAQLRSLSAGMYIIGGRKVLIAR